MRLPSIRADDAYYLNVSDNAAKSSADDLALPTKHPNDPVSGRFNVKTGAYHFAHPAIHAKDPAFSDYALNTTSYDRTYVRLGRRLVRLPKRLAWLRI